MARKVAGTVTNRWLYQNGLAAVAELDAAGALKKRFVYATRSHVPDVMIVKNTSGADSVYRLVSDQLGSVRLVVNASSGHVAQELGYDAWGKVTLDTNPGLQPFGYVGGQYDGATGLVRFGARDYDAEAGRWTARDPIGFAGGDANLYAYVANDPANSTDPRGLLLGGSIDAGERAGQTAAESWAEMSVDPNASTSTRFAAFVVGTMASLWTPCTSDRTALVLSTAYLMRNAGGWKMRDGRTAHTLIDLGGAFRLEYHPIGQGAMNAYRWHVDALWRLVRHWPWRL